MDQMYLAVGANTKKLIFLLLIYAMYLLCGAAIFQALEVEKDREKVTHINTVRQQIMANHSLTSEEFHFMVRQVEEALKRRCRKKEESWCDGRWNYYSSLYFAVNVVTTIGYGHLAPETSGGKIFCMIFAFFGIPLNLTILKIVGDGITRSIQMALIFVIERRQCNEEVAQLRTKTISITSCLIIMMLILGGILYNLTEPWTFLDGLYFCFVTFSTIGFGDLVPHEGQAPDGQYEVLIEMVRTIVVLLGLSVLFSFVHLVLGFSDELRESQREIMERLEDEEHNEFPLDEENEAIEGVLATY